MSNESELVNKARAAYDNAARECLPINDMLYRVIEATRFEASSQNGLSDKLIDIATIWRESIDNDHNLDPDGDIDTLLSAAATISSYEEALEEIKMMAYYASDESLRWTLEKIEDRASQALQHGKVKAE